MKIKTLVLIVFATLGWTSIQAAPAPDNGADRERVKAILAAHDKLEPGIEEYFASVAEDVILMPNGAPAIEGKAAYRRHVEEFYASGKIQISHQVLEVYSFAEVVIVRGRAVGTYQAPGQQAINAFETKNVFVFRREPGDRLQVWQIIFNDSPRTS